MREQKEEYELELIEVKRKLKGDQFVLNRETDELRSLCTTAKKEYRREEVTPDRTP